MNVLLGLVHTVNHNCNTWPNDSGPTRVVLAETFAAGKLLNFSNWHSFPTFDRRISTDEAPLIIPLPLFCEICRTNMGIYRTDVYGGPKVVGPWLYSPET